MNTKSKLIMIVFNCWKKDSKRRYGRRAEIFSHEGNFSFYLMGMLSEMSVAGVLERQDMWKTVHTRHHMQSSDMIITTSSVLHTGCRI